LIQAWKTGHSHSIRGEIGGIIIFVLVIWIGFAADMLLPLEKFGLIPRRATGLYGIIFMPFLHGSLGHIISNTVPLLVLMLLLAGSRPSSVIIVASVIFLSGLLLWLFGRPIIHIGASGLVFGLITFLIFYGLFEKRILSIVVSLLVGFLYGGSLFTGVMPGQTGISWDGHFCGAAAGIIIAWVVTRK
jgi:membrane associated rhomboid family serine protease